MTNNQSFCKLQSLGMRKIKVFMIHHSSRARHHILTHSGNQGFPTTATGALVFSEHSLSTLVIFASKVNE